MTGRRPNVLLNISYRKERALLGCDLVLELRNLSNAGRFVTYAQTAFAEYLQYVQLRQRQVLIGRRREF